jgi:hypothetical protein
VGFAEANRLKEFIDMTGIISLMDEGEIAKLGKQGCDLESVGFVASM